MRAIKRSIEMQRQIEEAEKKAEEYEAEIRKKEEDLAYLKKKLQEEMAMSQKAANGEWRDISEVTFAEGDLYLLANLIYCEAGAEPYDGKVAVGSVVINRVLSSAYPDTVVGVIYQSRQFSPVARAGTGCGQGNTCMLSGCGGSHVRCYQCRKLCVFPHAGGRAGRNQYRRACFLLKRRKVR